MNLSSVKEIINFSFIIISMEPILSFTISLDFNCNHNSAISLYGSEGSSGSLMDEIEICLNKGQN